MEADHSAELVAAVEGLSADVQGLQRQIRVNKTWRTALAVLSAGLIVVVAVLLYTIVQVVHTERAQEVTRRQVLCPLYSLFVQSVDAPRQPGETDVAYRERKAIRAQIHSSYTQLGC